MKTRVTGHAARLISLAALAVALPTMTASAQTQILEVNAGSLETYHGAASAGQGVQPLVRQRGVHIDGTPAFPPTFSWAVAGNPFGDAWNASPRVGDLVLGSGAYSPTAVDWAGPTPGAATWVIGRSFNQLQASANDKQQGANWFQMSQPELVLYHTGGTNVDDVLYLVYGADRYLEFKRTAENAPRFKGKNGTAGVVVVTTAGGEPDVYTYTDQNGTETSFFGSNTASHAADWQVWKVVDAAGNTSYVGDASDPSDAVTNGYNADKTIAVAFDASSGGGRKFTYGYDSIAGGSRLTQVSVEVLTSGTWSSTPVTKEIARINYAYYHDNQDKGPDGFLKMAEVRTSLPESSTTLDPETGPPVVERYLRRRTFYIYYIAKWDDAAGRRGDPGMLKMVIGPEGSRRYDWEVATPGAFEDSLIDDVVDSEDLKSYSEVYFEYPSSGTDWRPSKAFFNGECGCAGVNGTYTFDYQSNSHFSNTSNTYDTAWHHRTVVQQPDGKYSTSYFDETDQALSKVMTNTAPSGSPTETWVTQVVRNSAGQVTEIHSPANVTGYSHADAGSPPPYAGTITTSSSVGLVTYIDRVSSTDMAGFPESMRVRKGTGSSTPAPGFVSWKEYTSTDFQPYSGVKVIRPLILSTQAYHTSTETQGTSDTFDQTDYSYSSWGTDNTEPAHLALKTITTTYPKVDSAKNGLGNGGGDPAINTVRYLRADGTTALTRQAEFADADDIAFIYAYAEFTDGRPTMRVSDSATTGALDPDPSGTFSITEEGGLDITTSTVYDKQGRPTQTTQPDGLVSVAYYTRLADGRPVTISIPRAAEVESTMTYFGPATYSVTTLSGKPEFTATIPISGSGLTDALSTWVSMTESDPLVALGKGDTVTNMRTNLYSLAGSQLNESRMYFKTPASGVGTVGVNFDSTALAYDEMGRKIRSVAPDATIIRSTYDTLGRTVSRSMGTDDTGSAGSSLSGTSNMTTTEALAYDGGSAGGNSHLTSRTLYVEGSSTGQRVTTYAYDYRGRIIANIGPQSPYTVTGYDNLGRAVGVAQYNNSSGLDGDSAPTDTTNRITYFQTFHDERGMVYKTTRHKITQGGLTGGDSEDTLDSLTWHDPVGRVIKTRGQQVTKTFYDRLGRATNRFIIAKLDEEETDDNYAAAKTVADDFVLEESQTYFQDTTGLALMTVQISRHPNDDASTGALDQDADLTKVDYSGGVIGRPLITSMDYDELHRLLHTVQVGTHNGSDYDRDGDFSTTPSSTNLVMAYAYDNSGRTKDVTDPRETVSRTLYDDAGRKVATIANYTSDSPTPGLTTEARSNDLYTRYAHTGGHMTAMWVDMRGDDTNGVPPVGGAAQSPADDHDQITSYIYGTTTGTPSQMTLASGGLLRAIKYPDSANTGVDSGDINGDDSDVVSYAYNAQGQQTLVKDQAGNVIETDYDTAGRQTERRATTIITPDFDDRVQRIETTYEPRGMVYQIFQYHDPVVEEATVLDEVRYSHDAWGNLHEFGQDVDSEYLGTGRSTYSVLYEFEKAAPSDARMTLRRTQMFMPLALGDNLVYGYGESGSINDSASRVETLTYGAVDVASYQYLGTGQVVSTSLPEAGVTSTVFSSGGTTYPGLDRFNRPINSQWKRDGGAAFYNVDVLYDADGGIYRTIDNVHKWTSSQHLFDYAYGNDDLNRLTSATRGNWDTSSINPAKFGEQWTLSQTGNWVDHEQDAAGDGTYEVDWTSTYNTANEHLTRANGLLTNDFSYNAVGEMSYGTRYVYDVWGQLVRIELPGEEDPYVFARYTYNGLGYRTSWTYDDNMDTTVDGDDTTYWQYYDERWRPVATYREEDGEPKEQFVFHAAGADGYGGSSYIDLVVLRDRDMGTDWDEAAGCLDDRIYYCQNWRADVSVLVKTTGIPIEWVIYDAYGKPSSTCLGDHDHNFTLNGSDSTEFFLCLGSGGPGNNDPDFNGSVGGDNDYTVWGDSYAEASNGGVGVLSRSKTDNRIGYAGYQWDATIGSYHVRHRGYNPSLGRWLSRDPAGNMDSASLYAYVNGHALTQRDSTGECGTPSCATAMSSSIDSPNTSPYQNCQNNLSRCMQDPRVTERLRELKMMGVDPHINCTSADDPACRGKCGSTHPGLLFPTIKLCAKDSCFSEDDDNDPCSTLIHELIHVRQYADYGAWDRRRTSRKDFRNWMLDKHECVAREYEAYRDSGEGGWMTLCESACQSCSKKWDHDTDACEAYCEAIHHSREFAGIVLDAN